MRAKIVKALKEGNSKGLSMAQICRSINEVTYQRYCGRRKCGFPNPRKRKHFTLFEHSCKYPYSKVMSHIRKLGKKGTVTITTESRFDKWKGKYGAEDFRRIVRLNVSTWKW